MYNTTIDHLCETPCCITQSEIIESLSKDGRFKSICKKIAKKPYLADDLYQEFFLALCETTDNRLIEAYEGRYLDVLCIGIINNIWGKRDRVKSYENGTTHPLHELCNNLMSVPDCLLPDTITEYDFDKDQSIQKANELIKELVEIKKESPDQAERFRARVFHYSNFKYKNTRQFSKISGIPYNVCWEANHKFKQLIKININDLRPDSGF